MSVLALIALSQPAAACGGFFCNTSDPIDQAAERIVFAHDEEAGEVEAHVQIFFSGSAEEFAWVVPVPDVPELFPSSDDVLTLLDSVTKPQFRVEVDEVENMKLAGRYRLRGFPTILLFVAGAELGRFSGARASHWIEEWVVQHLKPMGN